MFVSFTSLLWGIIPVSNRIDNLTYHSRYTIKSLEEVWKIMSWPKKSKNGQNRTNLQNNNHRSPPTNCGGTKLFQYFENVSFFVLSKFVDWINCRVKFFWRIIRVVGLLTISLVWWPGVKSLVFLSFSRFWPDDNSTLPRLPIEVVLLISLYEVILELLNFKRCCKLARFSCCRWMSQWVKRKCSNQGMVWTASITGILHASQVFTYSHNF
jgi:hypothetical protein